MVRALWPHLPPSRESRVNHWKPSLTAARHPDPCQASVSAKAHSCHAIHTHTHTHTSHPLGFIYLFPCVSGSAGWLMSCSIRSSVVLPVAGTQWPRAPGQGRGAEVGSCGAVVVFFSSVLCCCLWGIIFPLQIIFGILLEILLCVSFAFCWSCFACVHIHFFPLLMLHMCFVKMFNNHRIQYRVASFTHSSVCLNILSIHLFLSVLAAHSWMCH